MEKKHQANNTILEIKTDNKTVASNGEVIEEMCHFYENLYTSKSIKNDDINAYLNDVEYPKLSNSEKE